MSGPIDYRINISAIRREAIRVQRELDRQRRQAASAARRAAENARAQLRAKELAAKREATRQAAIREQERQRQAMLSAKQSAQLEIQTKKAREEAARRQKHETAVSPIVKHEQSFSLPPLTPESHAEPSLAPTHHSDNTPTDANSDEIELTETMHAETAALQQQSELRLAELLPSLITWQNEVATEPVIEQFHDAAKNAWQTKVNHFLSKQAGETASDSCIAQCEQLLTEAKQIYDQAGELAAKFKTRNELLQDVMASLQEIGFFVEDPRFENPSDPGGTVILKAIRGQEEMIAAVDLDDSVRSIWNDYPQDTCKDAFVEYVKQMNTKGLEIQTNNIAIQAPPQLLEKGARELPQQKTRPGGQA